MGLFITYRGKTAMRSPYEERIHKGTAYSTNEKNYSECRTKVLLRTPFQKTIKDNIEGLQELRYVSDGSISTTLILVMINLKTMPYVNVDPI